MYHGCNATSWPGIPVLLAHTSMNISWHLLLFLCRADTNPFKGKSQQDFSRNLSSHKCFSWWRVTRAQITDCPNLVMFSPFFRTIPPCDPTADDKLYHICITAISVSRHGKIQTSQNKYLQCVRPICPLTAVDGLFISTVVCMSVLKMTRIVGQISQPCVLWGWFWLMTVHSGHILGEH